MIISRTPFRVSFVGGGTDLPSFYARQPGAVISMAVLRMAPPAPWSSDRAVSYRLRLVPLLRNRRRNPE